MKDIERRLRPPVDYKSVAEKGPPFVDPQFQPGPKSLGNSEEMESILRDSRVEWRRVTEIYRDHRLFRGVDIDDVVQGQLGDCYYVSAIAGLSENPSRVQKLFKVSKENPYGCYAVVLYICGAERLIVLDDFFPAYSPPLRGQLWPFTHSKEQEIWVMLLEKAWAKAHGEYAVTSGGDPRESLSALTGAPATALFFQHTEKEALWKVLKESSKKQFVMLTGGAKQVTGLLKAHVYTLIRAVEVATTNSGNVRLVRIRNPWGDTEWTGEWADNSSNWTPELRRTLNHTFANDGTFFMKFDDYYNLYGYIGICQCYNSYLHSDQVVSQFEGCAAFQVLSGTRGFFSACGLTWRMLGKKNSKRIYLELYVYKDQTLQLVRPFRGELKEIAFSANPAQSNVVGIASIEAELLPGLYVMHAYYKKDDRPEVPYICFSSHTSKAIDLIGLPGKTEVKTITRAELMRAVGRYMKAKEIRLTERESAVGTKDRCVNCHPLTYTEPQDGCFRCDLCRNQRQKQEGRYTCNKCRYDVCLSCKNAPSGESRIGFSEIPNPESGMSSVVRPHAITMCRRKHLLECKLMAKFLNRLVICSSCGQASYFSSPRWVCEQCTYIICDVCRLPVSQSVPPIAPPVTKPHGATCSRNHKLVFDCTSYLDDYYVCEKCDRQGKCSAGRWHCPTCNYDLCVLCMPAPTKSGEKKYSPVAPSVITTCASGHMLWFSTYSYLSGLYECNKCFKQFECKGGRWFCLDCEYDICPECRPAPEDVEKYNKRCNNGHLMVQSKNRYGTGSYYRCSFCLKSKRDDEGRWWCPICGYDVCNECSEKDIENVEWPEPVDEVDRRCKGPHKLIRARETVPSFECQAEGREVEGVARFICMRCGMVQCQACAAKAGAVVEELPEEKSCETVCVLPSSGGATVELEEGEDDGHEEKAILIDVNKEEREVTKPEPRKQRRNEDETAKCNGCSCSLLQTGCY